jgi:ABC-2 type transport system ATP-binding protein
MIYDLASMGVTVFATTHYLDEAEHANRVAMIHGGVLRALATPSDFKKHYLRGQLLGVTCDDPRRAVGLLRNLAGVSEVTLYGTIVHLLAHTADAGAVQSVLQQAGIGVASVSPIDPTLEDTYISLMAESS